MSADQWKPCMSPSDGYKTIDGKPIKGIHAMRRKLPDGTWQYRPETPDEETERVSDDAW